MEKIMSRFNTFNSLLSQSSNNDDDDDDDEDAKEDEIPNDFEFNLEEAEKRLERPGTPIETKRVEVALPK